jgi:hypothetical protein
MSRTPFRANMTVSCRQLTLISDEYSTILRSRGSYPTWAGPLPSRRDYVPEAPFQDSYNPSLVWIACFLPIIASPSFPSANAVLANAQLAQDALLKAKQVTGGDAWDTIRTTHTLGKTNGLSGPGQVESWTDNLSGRKVTRFQLGPNSMAQGFDGQVVWFQDSSGETRVEGAESARRAIINNAYWDCLGYWFPQRWPAQIEAVTGWGSGGIVRSLLTRVKVLRLGTIEVYKPVTDLFLQPREGFTGPYVAGFIGTGVLKRFNITLDYPNQQLIMEPNANYNKPDVYDRSGMWINQADGMFEVIDVVAKGPAAVAGIKAGDEILAVDGHAAQKITLSDLREKLRSRPETKVRLTIKSGQQQREAEIVLCELV